MDWPFTFAVQMIDIPANKPISCMALKMCLAIMVFLPKKHCAALPILSSEALHVAAALLLVKKPLNQLFQSRSAFRQAHFRFLTISIPRVVNNHATKIPNTNKSQPEV